MLTLPLDPTDDRAKPAFNDVAGCRQWLGQLQFTNMQQAHAVLRGQLDELNHYPMRGLERLNILESMRETVSYVQADYSKKLIGKKLPLSEDELVIFVSIVGLWQNMVGGYQRCLQTLLSGDKQLVKQGVLLCQRCLLYSGLQIFEHLRSGYEFDGRLWQQMHELYAFSEEQGYQLEKVNDDLDGKNHPTSCQAIYVKTLLACYARPAELTRSQLKLLDRWLIQWSATITLGRRYTISKGDAPPLAVDLASLRGLQPIGLISPPPAHADEVASSMRCLAMLPLSKLMRVKIIFLQQGQTPQQLELGEECSSADCADLLNFLHHSWCELQGDRLAERCSAAQPAKVCYGLEGIYAHIANKPFKQSGKGGAVDSLERKQIATFGRVLSEDKRNTLADLGFALEDWQIENESILGAHLLREEMAGTRIGPNQIVAVRPADAAAYMLGAISWVHMTQAGQLSAGARYLPGVAQAIAVNSTGVNASMSGKSAAALLLPAVAALKTPSSLLLPRGWFQPGRIIEIVHQDNQKLSVKLGFSVEKGSDFERVSFSPV